MHNTLACILIITALVVGYHHSQRSIRRQHTRELMWEMEADKTLDMFTD